MPVPNSDAFVKLIGKEIIYKGPWNLMKYDVNISLESGEVCNYIFQYLNVMFQNHIIVYRLILQQSI